MPRVLPWLKNETESNVRRRSEPPAKRTRLNTSDDVVNQDLSDIATSETPRNKDARRRTRSRTPSTSPPPAPPDVEYMREGYDQDDRYMMVEDEFASMAQAFTNHIHHAEYVRLKKLAEEKGLPALQSTARPTDGRSLVSKSTEIEKEAATNIAKNDGMLQRESGEDQQAWRLDPTLSGLMMQSDSRQKNLRGMTRPVLKTRAAAGYSQSPHQRTEKRPIMFPQDHQSEEEDTDDLDGLSSSVKRQGGKGRIDARLNSSREGRSTVHQAASRSHVSDMHHTAVSDLGQTTFGDLNPDRKAIGHTFSDHARIASSEVRAPLRRTSTPGRKSNYFSSDWEHEAEDLTITKKSEDSIQSVLGRKKARPERHERSDEGKSRSERLQAYDDIPTFLV